MSSISGSLTSDASALLTYLPDKRAAKVTSRAGGCQDVGTISDGGLAPGISGHYMRTCTAGRNPWQAVVLTFSLGAWSTDQQAIRLGSPFAKDAGRWLPDRSATDRAWRGVDPDNDSRRPPSICGRKGDK